MAVDDVEAPHSPFGLVHSRKRKSGALSLISSRTRLSSGLILTRFDPFPTIPPDMLPDWIQYDAVRWRGTDHYERAGMPHICE